jgi:hypothetical protein
MSNLQEIERAVSQLSDEELADFRVWFAMFDAEIWDRQFEQDVAAGRLDDLSLSTSVLETVKQCLLD